MKGSISKTTKKASRTMINIQRSVFWFHAILVPDVVVGGTEICGGMAYLPGSLLTHAARYADACPARWTRATSLKRQTGLPPSLAICPVSLSARR